MQSDNPYAHETKNTWYRASQSWVCGKYTKAIEKESLFRQIGTAVNAFDSGYRILAKGCNDLAQFVPEGGSIPEFMLDAEPGSKPFAFGDFSYYRVICRSPVSVRTIKEKFVTFDQIDYLAYEFLDGKLIRLDAVKVIQMS